MPTPLPATWGHQNGCGVLFLSSFPPTMTAVATCCARLSLRGWGPYDGGAVGVGGLLGTSSRGRARAPPLPPQHPMPRLFQSKVDSRVATAQLAPFPLLTMNSSFKVEHLCVLLPKEYVVARLLLSRAPPRAPLLLLHHCHCNRYNQCIICFQINFATDAERNCTSKLSHL